MFGDHEQNNKRYIERVIYTKTLEWAHEREYRLCIPAIEENWNTMPSHPDEITELYLGARMKEDIKDEIVGLAKSVNPKIFVLQSVRGREGQISFFKY